MRKAQIALMILLIPCVLPRIRHFFASGELIDFGPYYTAAVLAREHQGVAIYSGADDGRDPQDIIADPSTIFSKTALSHGVRMPFLYVYPPILADLLWPVSVFPFDTALKVWIVFNYLTLPIIAFLIIRLAKLRLVSWGSLLILFAVFTFSPILQSISMGQVSVLLLLLWVSGIYCYERGWLGAAGFTLALATAIKLTPLIVVFPLLLWWDWKALRAFVLSVAVLGIAVCILNTPASVSDYFFHVLPPMSRGILNATNFSVSASIERLYAAFHHEAVYPKVKDAVPSAVMLFGKACGAAIVLAGGFFAFNGGKKLRTSDRVLALALFAVLSVCVAPVSWPHGYSVCFLALCLLWSEVLGKEPSNLYLALLFLSTIALTTFANRYLLGPLGSTAAHSIENSILLTITPLAGVVLALIRMSTLGKPTHSLAAPEVPSQPELSVG